MPPLETGLSTTVRPFSLFSIDNNTQLGTNGEKAFSLLDLDEWYKVLEVNIKKQSGNNKIKILNLTITLAILTKNSIMENVFIQMIL